MLSYILWQLFLSLQPDASVVLQQSHPNAFPSAERFSCRSIPRRRLRFDALLNTVVNRWQHVFRTIRDQCQSRTCWKVSDYLFANCFNWFPKGFSVISQTAVFFGHIATGDNWWAHCGPNVSQRKVTVIYEYRY